MGRSAWTKAGKPAPRRGAARVLSGTIVFSASVVLLLTSCSDPIGRAEERRRLAYDRGGTNREVCREARSVKAAYVAAGRHDEGAWLAVDIHCRDVEGPAGDVIAKQQSDAAVSRHR